MNLRIHREGYRIIAIATFIFIMIIALSTLMPLPAMIAAGLPAILLYIWVLSFFRNPVRMIPDRNESTVYAPADGKVVAIEETIDHEFLHEKCIQVSIFMSPLNVHVNRIPVSGKVVYTKYHPGKYLVAWHPKSSAENERSTSVIQTAKGRILVRQIAGAMARRIICYMNTGMEVEQGQEIGFIRFGSRVDLFLPVTSDIKVQLDQKVKGNKTVIATLA